MIIKLITNLRTSFLIAILLFLVFGENQKCIAQSITYNSVEYTITSDSTVAASNRLYYGDDVESIYIPEIVQFNNKSYIVNAIMTSGNIAPWLGIKELHLPKTIAFINNGAFEGAEKVAIDSNNPNFILSSDILFDKEYKRILFFAPHITGTYEIPETVTSVDAHAFDGSSLSSLIVGESIQQFGNSNFSSLKTLYYNVPDCPMFGMIMIENGATRTGNNFPEIEQLYLGKNVKTIPNGLMSGAQKLTHVDIPDNVETIGSFAFQECGLLEVTIGENIKHIGGGAFHGCKNLRKVHYNAINILYDEGLHDGLPTFFEECSAVSDVTIGEKVKSLPYGIFEGLYNLKEIILPNSLERIQRFALASTGITSITIPENIKYIEESALEYCQQLVELNYNAINIKTNGGWISNTLEKINIGPRVVKIPDCLAFHCKKLTNIVIPENIDSIGSWAFYDCVNLESLKFPTNLKYIEGMAFYGCTSLTELTIPENIKQIEYSAFGGCTGIKRLNYNAIYAEVTKSTGNSSFLYDSPIISIQIGDKVKYLPTCFLKDKQDLPDFEIPSNVKMIGDEAFYNSNIDNLKIPSTVEYIGEKAFHKTKLYDTFEVYNNIKYINNVAYEFVGDKQGEVELKDGITGIASGFLIQLPKGKNVTLPASLRYIGHGFLIDAWANTKINFLGNIPPQPVYYFQRISNSDGPFAYMILFDHLTLCVPKGCKQLYQEADYWKLFPIIETETTGINNVFNKDKDALQETHYDINGQLIDKNAKGIHIIKVKGEKTKKVVVE